MPKQFIHFPGQPGSLFQNTLDRLQGLDDLADAIVVCNEAHRFLVAEQLRQRQLKAHILLEPCGRNTAPAIAMAALSLHAQNPQATLLVLPADHIISDVPVFHEAVREAAALAQKNYLVTFGIVPSVPETGYGYIQRSDKISDSNGYSVRQFVEKPDLETATSYLADGSFYWNSGMFVLPVSMYLEQLGAYAPEILSVCRQASEALTHEADFSWIPADIFNKCPGDSIDYAVMEKTDNAAVVPLDAHWNDLGAWNAVWEVASKADNHNVINGDVLLESVSNCYIQADSRLVAAVGLSDTVIVETADAVLVAAMDRAQEVKAIVAALDADGRAESRAGKRVLRPWGSFESLGEGEGFQVKQLVVNPGAALSLQMHHYRAEHWTVVAGNATITRDDETHELEPNQSIFLPQGCRHRLANTTSEPVKVIEVQVGSYLGEDDIVRFEDVYGRTGN